MTPPISSFRSAPSSPRVGMPKTEAKPPAYAVRLKQHIAMGKTPAEAMRAIERADGHSGRLPVILETSMCGGRGLKRPKHAKPLTHRIMDILTSEWVYISDEVVAALGSSRENIYSALRDLRDQGRVEQSKVKGRNKATWRIKA